MNSDEYKTLLAVNQHRLTRCHEAMQTLLDKEDALRTERRRLLDAFTEARQKEHP